MSNRINLNQGAKRDRIKTQRQRKAILEAEASDGTNQMFEFKPIPGRVLDGIREELELHGAKTDTIPQMYKIASLLEALQGARAAVLIVKRP